ncbi:carboxypeptidase-like protein [Mesonia algae]|uniref:Carboxypeptidase-like protein n=1 Tax=Mesonia algae TaxID=213248 RepID=A0A2W7I6D2_9FLAO|nr:DUF5686 family protein [Mesonia algae]PZW41738.1 carboxypeptidase-like protein [Mesonia algae]
MAKFSWCILIFLCIPNFLLGQRIITGKAVDKNTQNPIPYANISIVNSDKAILSDIDGSFEIEVEEQDTYLRVSYIGYIGKKVKINTNDFYLIQLDRDIEKLDQVYLKSTGLLANRIIKKAIAQKKYNDPDLKFSSYSFRTYNKLIIDDQKNSLNIELDTTSREIKTIIEDGRAYLSEQISDFKFLKDEGVKQEIVATRTAGFKEPVYELLSLKVQSNTWYKEKYTVFGNDYAGPLSKNPFNNYTYKVLDTTANDRPAFVIYFQPKREKKVAGLEGVLYIDTLNYGLQKAVGQLKGEVEISAEQDFVYYPQEDIWFPKKQNVTILPGSGGKKVSIFGGNISLGSLPEEQDVSSKLFLNSTSINERIVFENVDKDLKKVSSIILTPNATSQPISFWEENRSIPFTERDENTFQKVDSIVKNQNINRKINVLQNFNIGYYPIGFFNLDLRTILKYNDFEGLRLGGGGVTNDKLSKVFRLQGYTVYGFKDREFKYNFGAGVSLNKKTNTWLNASYTKDIQEVGSFLYLSDARVYSLFEPRLVNINFYYEYRAFESSLQHNFFPELLSEFQITKTKIEQTGGYRYLNDGKLYSSYDLTELTASFRWSPFSDYLEAPEKSIEVNVGYPKFSLQVVQAINGMLDGDFRYTKIGAKMNYTINRITQNNTEIILEGDYAIGDLPLTHTFHAYPNNPNKDELLQRFSVAGRRTFETMYFSEFFSDRLATLQIKHRLRPLEISKKIKPEFVFVTRHAIGDISNQAQHQNITFNTLEHGYNEAALEINKILFGFGLNFAYRYGAYHLPQIEDNIGFKFTFYFQL